jgi:hypothetical protein
MLPLLLALAIHIPTDSVEVHRGDQGQTRVSPLRVESSDVRIDGSLDEPVWERATLLTGFTQYEPVEGVPAVNQTEVRMFYTSEAIYFGVVAYDAEPHLVRATLADRNSAIRNDDWIRITLDPFNDNRQAYLFYANPLGIQQDGLWLDGGGQRDYSVDFIWESRGRVTQEGWAVEIRIPYVSLRFPQQAVQTWAINFARETKRTGYRDSWAPITQNQANTLAQSGRLLGLHGIEPQRLIEINPVATGRRTGERARSGEYVRAAFEPDAGVNARLGVTQNLILDATFRPDFSQMESDEGQIAINERFGLFFSEKRPFFLEGAEVFRTPKRLVHTRSIVDPVGGAKLTGKVAGFNVGYLGALDESSVETAGERARFNLMRVQREFGGGSTVGALLTDRSLPDGGLRNRVFALDTRVQLSDRYIAIAQLAGSWSQQPGAGATLAPLGHFQLDRSGRELSWALELTDIGDDFLAESGYLRRLGETQFVGSARYHVYRSQGSRLERWTPEIEVEGFFDHNAFWAAERPSEGAVEAKFDLNFRNRQRLTPFIRYGFFEFRPGDYQGHRVGTEEGELRGFEPPEPLRGLRAIGFSPNLEPIAGFALGGRLEHREIPIYAEGSRGRELRIGPNVRLWNTSMSVRLGHTYSRLARSSGPLFSNANVSEARVSYRFTRTLSTRGTVQYNLQRRMPLIDSRSGEPIWVGGAPDGGRATGTLGSDLLLAYEQSPGRVVYLGWARRMTGPDTYRYQLMEPQAGGLFLKLSYLMRV